MKGLAKLVCLALLLLCIIPNAYSQSKLWGTLPTEGVTESGSVFQIELDGSDYTQIKDFVFANCGRPRGEVLYASNGKIYGIAEGGFGSFNSIIYEYDPATGSFEFVYSFFDSETGYGESAMGCDLVEHSNGKVYGMTQYGGDNNDGQLFEFNLQTRELSIKVHYESLTKGKNPLGGLLEASDGRMYGVTHEGGTHGLGVLYVYDPSTNIFAVLKHFDGVGIGANPANSPIQATNGKLIGLTRTGGTADLGTVYEYDIPSNTITKKHDFDGATTGSWPDDKFCLATNGMYYATTSSGGGYDKGALIEFDHGTGSLTNKLDFNGTNGRYPTGALIQYSDGYLYGKVSHGGLENHGVLFKFDPVSSVYTKLLDFYEEYGETAYDGLIIAPDGELIGVTWGGGLGNQGVLFEYTPSTGIYQQLIHFRYSEIGGLPRCHLIEAGNGFVYGTTTVGGTNNSGIIFRIDPTDRSFEKVFDFDYQNLGAGCDEGLMEASNGLLYGLASYGGDHFDGVMFVFDPSTFIYTILFHFEENVSGSYPVGKLVQGSNGSLYGVTERGGANGDGVLFEYMLSTQTYLILHEFNQVVSGKNPTSIMQASNGKLYGTAQWGGAYDVGVLFEYDLTAYSMSVAVDFDNLNKGALPMGVLLEYTENQLYGMTGHGGSDGGGVLYHYNASNHLYTKVKNFMYDDDGFSPHSSLMKASNDLIYGTASMGGPQDYGVIFSFDPIGGDYNVVHEFSKYADRPLYGKLLELESNFGIDDNYNDQAGLSLYPNPVEDVLNISVEQWDNKRVNIKVINQLGQLMLEHTTLSSISSAIVLDVESLETGIYFIQLTDEQGRSSLGKFVKAK